PTYAAAGPEGGGKGRARGGLAGGGVLLQQGGPRRHPPAMPATGRRWPIRIGSAVACMAAAVSLAGIAFGTVSLSSPRCFACAPALRRIRRRPSLLIGSAASRSRAPRG